MALREDFWSFVCERRYYLQLLLMFLLFMFILTLLSFLFGEPGTASYTMATLNLILIVSFGVVAAGLYANCLRRERNKEY